MLERYRAPILRISEGEIAQDPLDQREYEAFKACLPTWRDVLIAKVLRSSGLRVMELLRLERRHYDVPGPDFSVLVRRSKRRAKPRVEYERVYLPPGLGVELSKTAMSFLPPGTEALVAQCTLTSSVTSM